MTWTRSIALLDFEIRGWLYPDEHTLAHVTDCNRRTAMLERRVALARMEAAAMLARIGEERIVADTATRALHLRLDRQEEIVSAARATTVDPPGTLAHTREVEGLRAIVERHKREAGQKPLNAEVL